MQPAKSGKLFRLVSFDTTISPCGSHNCNYRQYRRRILKALNADLADEFRFTEEMLNENPKNYQIWLVLALPKLEAFICS